MVILKIWISAFVALALILCLQAALQSRAEHLTRTPVVRHT